MPLRITIARGVPTGAELLLEGQEVFSLGSAADSNLRLEDEGVAPNHARIFRDDNRFILMDVSGQGIAVNGRTELQAELHAGDEIAIGGCLLRVETQGPLAELKILKGPDEGRTFPLVSCGVLGRGVNASVALLDMKCSREHCRVERRDDGWYLIDLGSMNGTRLNEVKLETKGTVKLKTGDRLRLGGTLVEFRVAAAPPPAGKAAAAMGSVSRATPAPAAPPSGKVFEIDLEALDETPPSVPVPRDPGHRHAVTQRVRASAVFRQEQAAPGAGAALQGELEKMGFAQVVQFLNLSHKTGELIVHSPLGDLGVAFTDGNVTDAWGMLNRPAQECFFGIARTRRGHFEFHENRPARPVTIRQGTLSLLMEAMRLVDEATDPGE